MHCQKKDSENLTLLLFSHEINNQPKVKIVDGVIRKSCIFV